MHNLDSLALIVQNLAGAQMSPDPRDAYEYLEAARREAQRLLDEARRELADMDEWCDQQAQLDVATVAA